MDLAARTLLNPGDVAVVGLPTYFGGTGAWKSHEAEVVGIPSDDEGLNTDALEETLVQLQAEGKITKLVYVIPNFDNPTGATLPLDRRMTLLRLASEHDFVIVEDDPYGTLRYEGERIPSIQHFDREHRVVHIHSFSKILCPGFRLAMVSGEAGLIRKMVVAKQYVDSVTNTPAQFVALELLTSGAMDRRIEANKTYYRQKRDLLLQALDRHFPRTVRWTRPKGGFFIFVHLPKWMDGTQLLRESVEQNVAFVAGAPFFCDGSGHNTMRLSFSQIDPGTIDRAVATVADIIKRRIAEQG
jgi:2-aminoadipate transaminase